MAYDKTSHDTKTAYAKSSYDAEKGDTKTSYDAKTSYAKASYDDKAAYDKTAYYEKTSSPYDEMSSPVGRTLTPEELLACIERITASELNHSAVRIVIARS